ncbi:MAG: hypothetical protein JSR74_12340 [Proteobacteria bacterium]|nr:hypothetical protein [Pseudomonadota bacterium]
MSRVFNPSLDRPTLNVIDVLTFRREDLNNLAKALSALPEGLAAMLGEPGQKGLLEGLLRPMSEQLERIVSDMDGLTEGRLPRWYTD